MMKTLLVALAAALTVASSVHAQDATTSKPYLLNICIVSSDELGSMGKPVSFEYEGQEIKLCCKQCRKQFDKNPAAFLKKIQEAHAAAAAKS